jgi:hypothetical protein
MPENNCTKNSSDINVDSIIERLLVGILKNMKKKYQEKGEYFFFFLFKLGIPKRNEMLI